VHLARGASSAVSKVCAKPGSGEKQVCMAGELVGSLVGCLERIRR